MHLAGRLVLTQTLKARMPEPAVAGSLGELDLGHEVRLEPYRAFALGGRHFLEGRSALLERLELSREPIEIGRVEAGAYLARVNELVTVEGAEHERRERLSLHIRAAV